MDPITLGIIGLVACIACSGGSSDRFHYRKKNGSWRAYFNGDPPSKAHVLRDSDGYYVCWDRPLNSESDARRVANEWVSRYG